MAIASPLSSYDAALAWLYGRINYERAIPAYRAQNFKLERMREVLAALGDPHVGLPVVHVAGTKGKGSTSSMLAAVLQAAGYRTGLYTSPHLERTEERLSIDGHACASGDFVQLLEDLRPAIERFDEQAERCTGAGAPTFFEVMTAAAFLHFARRKVDVVVLEVGLGGRLDSTNVVAPAVSVITSISFDHTKQLGNTLAAIAGEKAGIIKPGVPVVTGVRQDEPLAVIERVAAEMQAPLYRAGREFQHAFAFSDALTADKLPRGRMQYHGGVSLSDLELGLLGEHQAANAAVALAALERLREQGWRIGDAAIRHGLASVRCPARIEVLRTAPTVVVDTAHNVASIAALIKVLEAAHCVAQRRLIFACSKDKDAEGMLRQLLPRFNSVVLTRFANNPRAIPPEELAALAGRVCEELAAPCECLLAPDPVAAWQLAQRQAGAEDLICITGSFFLAAELRSAVT
jgi:dihydrofolate synthase/folylpolyglutamate synthase